MRKGKLPLPLGKGKGDPWAFSLFEPKKPLPLPFPKNGESLSIRGVASLIYASERAETGVLKPGCNYGGKPSPEPCHNQVYLGTQPNEIQTRENFTKPYTFLLLQDTLKPGIFIYAF